MLRDLLDKGCAEIRILSRDEEKQGMLRDTLRNPNVRYFIGDIRDRESVDRAMAGADCLFH
jgi:UDP-glucose 4-epimerase